MQRTDSTPPIIQDYLDYRAYLRDWFTWKKQASPRFSQRAFAKRMGQSSPSIGVDLVSGRRGLTPALFGPLTKALGLDAEQRGYLQLLVNLDRAKTPQQRNGAWDRLSAHRWFRQARRVEGEGFRYVSDWTCPAVRELASRPDFQAEPGWIARTLVPSITEAHARRTLDTLFELGLLVTDDDGVVQQAEASVVTPTEVQGLAAHNYHQGMFDLAKQGITRFSADERHYTGVTVCVPEALVPDLKREIMEFAERLLERCDRAQGDPERVFQVHLAAFPLSRSPKEDP